MHVCIFACMYQTNERQCFEMFEALPKGTHKKITDESIKLREVIDAVAKYNASLSERVGQYIRPIDMDYDVDRSGRVITISRPIAITNEILDKFEDAVMNDCQTDNIAFRYGDMIEDVLIRQFCKKLGTLRNVRTNNGMLFANISDDAESLSSMIRNAMESYDGPMILRHESKELNIRNTVARMNKQLGCSFSVRVADQKGDTRAIVLHKNESHVGLIAEMLSMGFPDSYVLSKISNILGELNGNGNDAVDYSASESVQTTPGTERSSGSDLDRERAS